MSLAFSLPNIFHVQHNNDDVRRRGRNLIVLCVGLIVTASIFLINAIIEASSASTIWFTFIPLLIMLGVAVLARYGHVTVGAWLLVIVLLLATAGSSMSGGQVSVAPFYFVIPMLVGCLTLRPWQIGMVWVVCLILLTVMALSLSAGTLVPSMHQQVVMGGYVLTTLTALIGVLNASTTELALNTALYARRKAEEATSSLEVVKASLERRVDERTTELQSAFTEVEARSAEQARLLQEIEQQRIAIRELSVPVLPVSRTSLVIPLVGALDSERLLSLQEEALRAVERTGVRELLLDITGVPIVDTQVAKGILEVVQAARLLGAEVTLVGIRPEVAQAIVGLGLDLSAIRTFSDLQGALGQR
jgi:rsbT co-antagonist protein RsbR